MSTTTVPAEITRFAQQVRAELADLSAEDLEDLTDGLEADLAEAWAETPDRTLPDPTAYAVELRTAAGLPPQPSTGRGVRGALRGMSTGLRTTGDQMLETLRAQPVTSGAIDFAAALQPFWWVLRAWVAYQLLATLTPPMRALPHNLGSWLVLAVLVMISVQWGRNRWRPWGWLTGLVVIGNVVAALLLLPFLMSASSTSDPDATSIMLAQATQKGLSLDGRPVTNIYAYGSDGEPISKVQLFDQSGRPLDSFDGTDDVACSDASCDDLAPAPARLETGEEVRNVYPLTLVPMRYDEYGNLVPADPRTRPDLKPPFAKVPKVELKAPDQAAKVE